jgi:hypothetical protein
VPARWKPFALLAGLGLLFFADLVLHPNQILYSDKSDLLAETLPAKRFLVRWWQKTGEVPLWCPFSYAGLPFVHDVKVGVFYPLHLLLYLLPEEWVGVALSWLVVLHVILAGWFMYLYASTVGLGPIGAFVAAFGYMFSGRWLFHILAGGHYVMAPLAWLPLILFFFDRALHRSAESKIGAALRSATWAGSVYALIVLGGHPQVTFYSGVFIALWSFGTVWSLIDSSFRETQATAKRKRLLWWLVLGVWMLLVSVALAAIELFPALEATREATRSSGVASGEGLDRMVQVLVVLVGPYLGGPDWEDPVGLGILWLTAVLLAPLLCRGRARFEALVLAILVIYSLGGGFLLQWLPGFRLFQLNSRMLLLAWVPIALLAGRATEALFVTRWPSPATGPLAQRVLVRVLFLVLFLVAIQALIVVGVDSIKAHLHWRFHLYWLTLLVTVPAAWWLLGRSQKKGTANLQGTEYSVLSTSASSTQHSALSTQYSVLSTQYWVLGAWIALLAIDLWAMTWPLVQTQPESVLTEPADCIRFLSEQNQQVMARQDRLRVLDQGAGHVASASPLGTALPMLEELEPLRGYNSVDIRRYKEYLQFITDEDKPQIPREGAFGFPIMANFPLKNKPLLDLLGTRYLLTSDRSQKFPAQGWQSVCVDEHPEAYMVILGGRRVLPPFVVYENPSVFPRAFVVPQAKPLPERSQVLPTFRHMTKADFEQTVFLEDFRAGGNQTTGKSYRPARIVKYEPNQVVVALDRESTGGYLVLADIWFPGWTCTVDGEPAQLHRANYLFRATPLSPGAHEIVFTFTPDSYRWGKIISATTLGAALLLLLVVGLTHWRRSALRASAPPAAAEPGGRGG